MLAEMGLTLGKILRGSCKLVATTASCGREFHNVRFVKKYFLSLMCPESSSVQLHEFYHYEREKNFPPSTFSRPCLIGLEKSHLCTI